MTSQKLIETLPVGRAGDRLITLAVIGFFAVYLSIHRATPGWLLTSFLLLTLVAICTKAVQSFHLSLFCTLWVSLPFLIPFLITWSLYKVTPLAVYAGIVGESQNLRKSILWMRPGRLTTDIWLFVLVVAVISGAALMVWNVICRPDLSPNRANIPSMPIWLLPLAGITFALINSAVEEAIFRGIFLQALDSAIGAGAIPLVIQAVLFGWLHHSAVGFPKGLLGIAMASSYGLLLGFLRYRARGMLAPWVAHTGTDMAVFAIVATS